MIKYISFLLLFFCFSAALSAQPDPRLAEYYFQNGELEKAASIFEQLNKQGNSEYFDRYVTCLMDLNRNDEAEKNLQKQIKKEPTRVTLYVTYGKLYEKLLKPEKAEEQYKKAIDKLTPDRYMIDNLAMNFNTLSKYDWSLKTYEHGADLLKNKNVFSFNMAELYRRNDDNKKMINAYLNSLTDNYAYLPSVEAMLQRYISTPEEQTELQTQIYTRIQEEPKNAAYPELMSWFFLQKKDYKNAFRQLKSVDRINNEDGRRVFDLAVIAEGDHDYDAAIDGYNYVLTEKGRSNLYFIEAKRNALACKRKKLTEGFGFTNEELKSVEKDYESFLDEVGRNNRTASIIAELADLEAFYLKDLNKAIALLDETINYPMIDRDVQSRAKLSLGDFYLVKGERWEATLLYSQVDKLYKDDALGHEARFKNAKLAYYFGDFDWAKAQFDVLKASTSKLISNDAIDMSVFIMDNTGLDSTTAALNIYAQAELLVFQNRYDAAFIKLDSIDMLFPKHALADDVLYLRAQIYKKLRQYDKAIAAYNKIITEYKEDIRADNALFEMAELYETRLNDKSKAKELYEKLFTDFSNSTLAVEARKRFRNLRGDKLKEG